MGSKGGGSSTTVQSNEPPAWAKPLLQKSASEAMRLYDASAGYHPFPGQTQAPLSAPSLGGMNALLAATGYTGAPIVNLTAEQQYPDLFRLFALQEQERKKRRLPPPKPTTQEKPKPVKPFQEPGGTFG